MEYVGARATDDNTIDMASNGMTRQALKAKNQLINTLQTRCLIGRAAFNVLSRGERKYSIASGSVTTRVFMGGESLIDGTFLESFRQGIAFNMLSQRERRYSIASGILTTRV